MLNATLGPNTCAARFDVAEPSHGLLSGIAGLSDDLGPISISAELDGPRTAEQVRLDRELRGRPANQHRDGVLELRACDANIGKLRFDS